jgi:hypothetical protein
MTLNCVILALKFEYEIILDACGSYCVNCGDCGCRVTGIKLKKSC